MNNATVTGRLGRDAEQRSTTNGKTLITFSICDSDPRKKDKEPNWVRVTLNGETFKNLFPYLKKGKLVEVIGRIELRKYTSNGKDGCSLDIPFPLECQLLDKPEAQKEEQKQEAPKQEAAPADLNQWKDANNDDIPF